MLQVAEIATRTGPSVVGLGRGWGRGSGVVIAQDLVLTSAHILRGPDVVIAVSGAFVQGRVAGADRRADLAVVVADTGAAPPVEWATQTPAIGTEVFALADPGGRGLRVTAGYVTTRPHRGIEHTAPLPPGSSGGPLVDADGRLLGLNTVRLEGGFILAMPAPRATVDALARSELPQRVVLGVALGRGLIVRAVQDASPAAVAGVVPGDRLRGVNDHPLRSLDDLLDALDRGGELTLTVVRDGAQHDIAVTLQ